MTDYAPAGWTGTDNFEIDVPSGGKVLARKISMEDIVDLGLVDKLDTFGNIVGKGSKKAKGKTRAQDEGMSEEEILAKRLGSKANFKKMVDIINEIMVVAVIKPPLFAKPPTEDERRDGLFYVDRIPFQDKMHIFNLVFSEQMGGDGMEDFREGPEQGLGTLAEKPSPELPAESSSASEESSESVLSG